MISKQLLWPGHRRTPLSSVASPPPEADRPPSTRHRGRPAEPRLSQTRRAGRAPGYAWVLSQPDGGARPSTRGPPRTFEAAVASICTRRRRSAVRERAPRRAVQGGCHTARSGGRSPALPRRQGASASRRGARAGVIFSRPRVQSFGELSVLLPLGPGSQEDLPSGEVVSPRPAPRRLGLRSSGSRWRLTAPRSTRWSGCGCLSGFEPVIVERSVYPDKV